MLCGFVFQWKKPNCMGLQVRATHSLLHTSFLPVSCLPMLHLLQFRFVVMCEIFLLQYWVIYRNGGGGHHHGWPAEKSALTSEKEKTSQTHWGGTRSHHPFLCLRGCFFFFFFPSSLLAAAVLSSFSPGDDEGRTTATRREMKSRGRGGENKINRSSETKGHLLAPNDNLSSKHER